MRRGGFPFAELTFTRGLPERRRSRVRPSRGAIIGMGLGSATRSRSSPSPYSGPDTASRFPACSRGGRDLCLVGQPQLSVRVPQLQDFSRSPLTDSNRRPPPYHGGALPTELRGRNRQSSRVEGDPSSARATLSARRHGAKLSACLGTVARSSSSPTSATATSGWGFATR
jgi:hypothetical protein